MSEINLTSVVTKGLDACSTGFAHPGSQDKVPARGPLAGAALSPGALRGCPELRLKDARRRDPSEQPPGFGINSTGLLEMPHRQVAAHANVTDFSTYKARTSTPVVQSAAPPPQKRAYSIDQIGDNINGMAHVEATISIAALNSLLLLLEHPSYVVVAVEGGGLRLDYVPPDEALAK